MSTELPHRAYVAGRTCGDCTLCCKLLRVVALDKPRATWCDHCDRTAGCRIYPDRPQECRDFDCGYLLETDVGEEWRPRKSRMVLAIDRAGGCIAVHVDPDRSEAWRQPLYRRQMANWAAQVYPKGGNLLVWVGSRAFAILPDREKDLGEVGVHDVIVTSKRPAPGGVSYDVRVERSQAAGD